LKLDATHVGCATLRALALSHLGRSNDAASAMREVLALDPENVTTQAGKGWQLLLENKPRAARAHFLEALRVSPESLWAQEGLLECLKTEYRLYRWRHNIAARWTRLKTETRFLLLLLGAARLCWPADAHFPSNLAQPGHWDAHDHRHHRGRGVVAFVPNAAGHF